ncbi:ADP-ribosyltransferase exoenzyme [anaerobic digester metagenome]
MLAYADGVASQQTLEQSVYTTIDIASLALSGSAVSTLAKLPSLRRAFVISDLVSDFADLASIATSDLSGGYSNLLGNTSAVFGLLSLSEGGVRGVKSLLDKPVDVPEISRILGEIKGYDEAFLVQLTQSDKTYYLLRHYLEKMRIQPSAASTLAQIEECLNKVNNARRIAKAVDWAKYVDDFFANSNVITSKNRILNKGLDKVYTQLSIEEITAIHHYTTGAYKEFNAALRAVNGNISALNEFNRAFYVILQSGMQKMPTKFTGHLYRGTSLSEEALMKYNNAFKNKTSVTEYSYTSTSQGTDVYEKFQNLTKQEGDMPVLIFVNAKGKYGVDIDGISRYGRNFTELGGDLQREVLYMSGAKFKVTEYVEDVSAEGQKYIKMVWEEIP